jgi:hypothetical protein
MKEMIHYFGYNEFEGNTTSFFKYENPSQELLDMQYQFKRDSDVALKKVIADGGWKGPKYHINKDPECFEMFPMDMVHKLQYPGRDFASRKLFKEPWTEKDDII